MKDQERDVLRKVILELLVGGCVHWTALKKKTLGTCHMFATDSTFAAQMKYLLSKGLIRKEARGAYVITEKGKQYLKIMT